MWYTINTICACLTYVSIINIWCNYIYFISYPLLAIPFTRNLKFNMLKMMCERSLISDWFRSLNIHWKLHFKIPTSTSFCLPLILFLFSRPPCPSPAPFVRAYVTSLPFILGLFLLPLSIDLADARFLEIFSRAVCACPRILIRRSEMNGRQFKIFRI